MPLNVPFCSLPALKGHAFRKCKKRMAGTTGLEPATSAVTGKRMTFQAGPPKTAKCGLNGRNHNRFRAICW